jgi:hypothetical protein
MYVRKKFMQRGDKVYGPYWQLVRSTRVNGKPRQKVVANVGPAENREEADTLARAKGLLCGATGCGEAGTVERVVFMRRGQRRRKAKKDVLLCAEHESELTAGKMLTGVALERE